MIRPVLIALVMLGAMGCQEVSNLDPASNTAQPDEFAQTFLGGCAIDFPDTSKLRAAALAFKWQPITDKNLIAVFAPSSKQLDIQYWLVTNTRKKLMVAVGRSELDSKPVHICSIVGETINVDETRGRIADLLKAIKISEVEESGQNYIMYKFTREDQAILLSFIDAKPMGMKTLNVSIISDWRAK